MSQTAPRAFLALRDRAHAFLMARGHVPEAALLAHVYGGAPPPSLLGRLVAPLLDDPRLQRAPDGEWSPAARQAPPAPAALEHLALTTLALAASGPNPERARVVQVCALHVRAGATVERFSATLNPEQRVPGYVAERLGLAPEVLDGLPAFASILGDLARFLGTRPILAQDARLAWAFVSAEARRTGTVLPEPLLIDVNEVATRVLDLEGKPTLGRIAAHLGIPSVHITRPDEEARVLGALAAPLLEHARRLGSTELEALLLTSPAVGERKHRAALRREQTARSQPDAPGVYVMRDGGQAALYVGKARRLRSRVAAYVHRPLGPTRRLEGLVGSVDVVDSTVCATDLEALVLEDREIRRLQPRYNTVRRQRAPRLWIRLPPERGPVGRARQPAQRRLEPSLGPGSADGDFVGPFRNETIAARARLLARSVFELDRLRGVDLAKYEEQLVLAWRFLKVGGEFQPAQDLARLRSSRLLRQVVTFDPRAQLLPADPRNSRYVVLRPGPAGIEGFVLDCGVFNAWSVLQNQDVSQFAADLLASQTPRTSAADSDVVLRWLGAQRPPALLVLLPPEREASDLEAADAIQAAALLLGDLLLQSRPPDLEDAGKALGRSAAGAFDGG